MISPHVVSCRLLGHTWGLRQCGNSVTVISSFLQSLRHRPTQPNCDCRRGKQQTGSGSGTCENHPPESLAQLLSGEWFFHLLQLFTSPGSHFQKKGNRLLKMLKVFFILTTTAHHRQIWLLLTWNSHPPPLRRPAAHGFESTWTLCWGWGGGMGSSWAQFASHSRCGLPSLTRS